MVEKRIWKPEELWVRDEYPDQVAEIVRQAKIEAYDEAAAASRENVGIYHDAYDAIQELKNGLV